MPRWQRLLIILAVGSAANWLVWSSIHEQPTYKGRELEEWLYNLPFDGISPQKAVREIGSEAIPCVRRWTRIASQDWANTFLSKPWASYLPGLIKRELSRADERAQDSRSLVVTWIRYMGEGAAPLVPQLTELLKDPVYRARRHFAMEALGAIGTNGVAPLIKAAEDPHYPDRKEVLQFIWQMGTNAAAAEPALYACMSDPQLAPWALAALGDLPDPSGALLPVIMTSLSSRDWTLRGTAVTVLGRRGGTKQELTQFLAAAKPLLSDPDLRVRMAATNACGRFEGVVSTSRFGLFPTTP